jgi:aspartokinase/homoserine dehydrogenase 1
MDILKFGGTSLQDTECQQRVLDIISHQEQPCWVVVSAFGGATDQLFELAHEAAKDDANYRTHFQDIIKQHNQIAAQLLKNPGAAHSYLNEQSESLRDLLHGLSLVKTLSPNVLASILSFGELFCAYILSEALKERLGACSFIDAREIIETQGNYDNARVDFGKTNAAIQSYYKKHNKLGVVTGFIARNNNNETTNLGRSGSDYTASILGAALKAKQVVIYTDVNGVMTADPRIVPRARVLRHISYHEAMEMSHFGATVIHPATMTPLIKENIPIQIRNTFDPEAPGTLIGSKSSNKSRIICGLSSQTDVALLTIQGPGLQGITGIAGRVFNALAGADINIILISQASSEQSICFVVSENDAARAQHVLENLFSLEIQTELVAPISVDNSVAIIAVVGENMRQRIGIAGNLFRSISKVRVNIIAIAQGASELNISIVVRRQDEAVALRALHAGFFETQEPMQLFIFGATGLIGSTLVEQLSNFQSDKIDLQLYGLANSKHMIISSSELSKANAFDEVKDGLPSSINEFVEKIKAESHLPKRIFVDCSANDEIANHYETLLNEGVSIVTPNKRANSGPLKRYQNIMSAVSPIRPNYHYEVTVGAGLPIIETVKNLVGTGDKLHKIEAVLSGSLNYIFSNFANDTAFSDIVKQAKEKGFTEPDPRDDLGGLDVARKLLILLREWGFNDELDNIDIQNLVPQDCQNISIDDFFTSLATHNNTFLKHLKSAEDKQQVLRYVATFDGTNAMVGLQTYDETHPFYRLDGSNNMLILTTDRYKENPLIIEGPGAGADVTAAGVLADILSLAGVA